MIVASDGSYLVAGQTNSFGAGDYDLWILKLDTDGTILWQKTYGGAGEDSATSIIEASNGGFVVSGYTQSFGAGERDFWVLKLDTDGAVIWQKTMGTVYRDVADSICEASDGGYVASGNTSGVGLSAAWLVKFDSNGNIVWQKKYGEGSEATALDAIRATIDGGFIAAGYSEIYGAGNKDFWVVKLDANGAIEWQNTYGGAAYDDAYCIIQALDGGYVVSGRTYSFGTGGSDVWALKLDPYGDIEWQKAYGGIETDRAKSVLELSAFGFVVAGETRSFGAGVHDMWVLQMDDDGLIPGCTVIPTFVEATTSTAYPVNTSAVPTDSNAIPYNSNASAENAAAVVNDLCSFGAVKPYTFHPGTPAKASEVNENFDVIYDAAYDNLRQILELKAIICQEHPSYNICQ